MSYITFHKGTEAPGLKLIHHRLLEHSEMH